MKNKITIEITRGEQMALIDLISSSLLCRCPSRIAEFYDCSVTPATITTPGQLLRLISNAKPTPETEREQ